MSYNVTAMRKGKRVKWNKKSMSYNDAQTFVEQLRKATIPSVEANSIKIVKKIKRPKG